MAIYQMLKFLREAIHDDMSPVSSAEVVHAHFVFFELDVTSTAGTGWI